MLSFEVEGRPGEVVKVQRIGLRMAVVVVASGKEWRDVPKRRFMGFRPAHASRRRGSVRWHGTERPCPRFSFPGLRGIRCCHLAGAGRASLRGLMADGRSKLRWARRVRDLRAARVGWRRGLKCRRRGRRYKDVRLTV